MNRRTPCTAWSRLLPSTTAPCERRCRPRSNSRGERAKAPREVVGGARLVGVDEDKVKGTAAFRGESRKCVHPSPEPYLNDIRESSMRKRFSRATSACFGSDSSVIKRPPAGNARAKPDRAVAPQSADLQNVPRPFGTHQH